MTRTVALTILLGLAGGVAADDPKPFALDKLDPAKLPPPNRPAKALPKEVVAVLGQRGDKVDCFAFRGDGRFLAVSGPDQGLRIWDLDGVKVGASAKMPDSVVCLAFDADGKRLAVGDAGGTLRLFEKAETRAPVLKAALPAHQDGPVWAAAFSPDGKALATGGRDKVLKIWDLTKPKPVAAALAGHEDGLRAVAFAPDGARLFTAGGGDEQLRVWDLSGDKPKAGEVVRAGGRVIGVAVSPDGKLLATSGAAGAAKVWAVKDGKPADPTPLEADGKGAWSVGFAPDGGTLVGISVHSPDEDRALVWGADGKKRHEFKFGTHLHAAGFAPDGRHLVVVTQTVTLLVRLPK
jgi:WD40 repeat protein